MPEYVGTAASSYWLKGVKNLLYQLAGVTVHLNFMDSWTEFNKSMELFL
jgi:hypothetical protein